MTGPEAMDRRVELPRGSDRPDEARSLVRTIVERVADGLLLIDTSGAIKFANPAAVALLCRSANELVGTEFGFPMVAGETTEIDLVRPGGSLVTAELRVTDVPWEGRSAHLVSLRDITARKEAELAARRLAVEQAARKEAEAAEERAEHLARIAQAAEMEAKRARAEAEAANQSKSAFLATMSHELRTPLNAIGGYAQLMEEGLSGPLTEKQREYLKRVRLSQLHLEALINDVLNFAKLEAGRLDFEITEFGLPDGLSSVAALVEPQAGEKGIRFEFRGGDQGCVVRADRDKVLQIVLNLVSNAVKFTSAGGSITLDWLCDGESVRIRVADTGIGIPRDKLAAVFEPFVQVDRNLVGASHGTGLGLTISRDLARRMGGDLTVESELGTGSTFALRLPLAEAHRQSEDPILAA
jgi:signal transduction histidine kinase